MTDHRLCQDPGCAYRGKHVENCAFCFGWGFYASLGKKIMVNGAEAGRIAPNRIRQCNDCGGRADMEPA